MSNVIRGGGAAFIKDFIKVLNAIMVSLAASS